jgi:hypothetical protein
VQLVLGVVEKAHPGLLCSSGVQMTPRRSSD